MKYFLKVGDLVEESFIVTYKDPKKTLGFVMQVKLLENPLPEINEPCQSVKVMWANWGTSWSTNIRLKKVA